MHSADSPSMITIMSYCSSARVRRRRLSLSAWRFASISSLIQSVSCRQCSPNAPFARLEMFTAERP
jgi:hypothetical protein